jgi:enoyl-CoA hydratase/carnithine racemase
MTSEFRDDGLPELEHITCELRDDGILLMRMDRPAKRNALNDAVIDSFYRFFSRPPAAAKVVVLCGNGDHFCAGLDLSEHQERAAMEVMKHSQHWHETFRLIEFGGLPIVSALHGAVIGGGLELAMSTHVRIAEPSTRYALPEGRRGIFVGGGASVRVARAIGADRTREMMLTGRTYSAEDGLRLGLAHYLVGEGEALDMAIDYALRIAGNAPASNYMMINALARIENMSTTEGLFTESLAAALTQTSPDAREGMRAFLEKRDVEFGKTR